MRLPNGYGSVYKLSGNRRNPYAARITIGWEECDGKRIQKKKILGYYPTKEAALNALADFNRNPYNPESSCITFEKVYEKWAAQKAFQNKSKLCKRLSGGIQAVRQPLQDAVS